MPALYSPDGSWNSNAISISEAGPTDMGPRSPYGDVWVEWQPDAVSFVDTRFKGIYNIRGNIRAVKADLNPGKGIYAPNGAIRISGIS